MYLTPIPTPIPHYTHDTKYIQFLIESDISQPHPPSTNNYHNRHITYSNPNIFESSYNYDVDGSDCTSDSNMYIDYTDEDEDEMSEEEKEAVKNISKFDNSYHDLIKKS